MLVQVKSLLFSKALCESIRLYFPTVDCVESTEMGLRADIERCRPDIVFLEAESSFRCVLLFELRRSFPSTKLLLLLPGETAQAVKVQYLADGVDGYVMNDQPPETLARAIEALRDGQIWAERATIAMALRTVILQKRSRRDLTLREREVLLLLSAGLKTAEIAQRMCLSVSSVKGHLQRAYRKLGTSRGSDAVKRFAVLQNGETSAGAS
jgi:DNA-binding NarL/FixJ family response regulator